MTSSDLPDPHTSRPLVERARAMRESPQPQCPACAGAGDVRYESLADPLFGAGGRWRMRRCTNGACAMLWLDPAPHPDDLHLAYADYYTHAAAVDGGDARAAGSIAQQVWAAWRLGYPMPNARGATPRALALLARPRRIESASFARLHLPFVPDGRLLDVGCGAGNQLRAMRAFGWQVSGVDPDAKAVAAARAAGLDVRHGDLTSTPWPADQFDAVAMVHVVEHLVDPARHLREAWRILRPRGRLVVITPNVGALGHRWFRADWRGLEPPRHLQLYSRRALAATVAAAGFTMERIDSSARDAAHMLWFSAQLSAARRAGEARVTLRTRGAARRWWRGVERLQRGIVLLGVPLGEELVCIARKPAQAV